MNISDIRKTIQDCEYSIIYALLERSRWKYQKTLYSNKKSLFYQLLTDTEIIHEKVARYNSPEEHPFTKLNITNTTPKRYLYHQILESNHKSINHNTSILNYYINNILPMISLEGTDDNMGSAITADINLLQAISRRCHLGKVVSALKFRDNLDKYLECNNVNDILDCLTNSQIEKKILTRIIDKTQLIKTIAPHSTNIDPIDIESIFKTIMDITKQIQVDYILYQKNGVIT